MTGVCWCRRSSLGQMRLLFDCDSFMGAHLGCRCWVSRPCRLSTYAGIASLGWAGCFGFRRCRCSIA